MDVWGGDSCKSSLKMLQHFCNMANKTIVRANKNVGPHEDNSLWIILNYFLNVQTHVFVCFLVLFSIKLKSYSIKQYKNHYVNRKFP